MSHEISMLRRDLEYAVGQLALEREKNFATHRFLINKFDLKLQPGFSIGAELAPMEKYFGTRKDRCVIAFAGMALKLGVPVAEFARILTGIGPDVLCVKDFKQCWYQQGLLGITSDVVSTASYLEDAVAYYSTPLQMVGSSGGGFAAILFAALMGGSTALAFGPQTLLDSQMVYFFGSQDTRIDDVLSGQMLDLRAVLKDHPVPDVRIFYGEENCEDTEAAQYLCDIPGVSLFPYPTDTHAIARWLRARGELADILQSSLT